MRGTCTPWDALLHVAPQRLAMPGTSKTDCLLAELVARGCAPTATLAVCTDLTHRQVWGLLKYARAIGKVRFDDGLWSLVHGFAGRDVERAAALLRERGWRVEPPEGY